MNNLSSMQHNTLQQKFPLVPPTPTTNIVLKADSGATRHYFSQQDSHILQNKFKVKNGPQVKLPTNEKIQATHNGIIPWTNDLTYKAKLAHVLPHIRNSSLLSLGQLCDDNCDVWLSRNFI